jgi:hypothetical protein
MYLGDGTISAHARKVFRLRVFLDIRYPLIIEDCARAMLAVVPKSKVNRLARRSNFGQRDRPSHVEVSSFSKAWPCLIPQHGPGRKHERSIILTDWQRDLIELYPQQLLRGLIHSDGCRFVNSGRGDWRWPRYAFVNESADIREIFSHGCEKIGVQWTEAGTRIYVSRKADVARLDQFIGPKA